MTKFMFRRTNSSLKEGAFNQDAIRCLKTFTDLLTEMEAAAPNHRVLSEVIPHLKDYAGHLKEFLEKKNPTSEDTRMLGAENTKLEAVLNKHSEQASLPGIAEIIKGVTSMPSALTNHPTKTQRLYQAIKGLGLMTAGTAFAAGVTFVALAATAPSLFMSWLVIPPALEAGSSSVAEGVNMIRGAIKDPQATTSINALVDGLKTLKSSVETMQAGRQEKPSQYRG